MLTLRQRIQNLAFNIYCPWSGALDKLIEKISRFSNKLKLTNYALIILDCILLFYTYVSPSILNISALVVGTLILVLLSFFHLKLDHMISSQEYHRAIDFSGWLFKKDVQAYERDILKFIEPLMNPEQMNEIKQYLFDIIDKGTVNDKHKATCFLRDIQKGIDRKNFALLFDVMEKLWLFKPHLVDENTSVFKNIKVSVLTPINKERAVEKEMSIGEDLYLKH